MMSNYGSGATTLEYVTRSLFTAVSSICFVGMIALAVHLVSHPQGPLQAHRFYHGHFTNFVDPEISTTVTGSVSRGFEFRYTVSNGFWGFQDIRELVVPAGPHKGETRGNGWAVSKVGTGIGSFGVLWSAGRSAHVDPIRRGETRGGFHIKSTGLPVIMPAHAGHDLNSGDWRGYSSDLTTPAGKRVTRWVIGPRAPDDDISPHALIGSLVPGVHRARELGWIRDPALAGAVRRTLTAAAMEIKLGDIPKATARLDRLIQIIEANAGIQTNDEAYALIVFNVKHVIETIAPSKRPMLRSSSPVNDDEAMDGSQPVEPAATLPDRIEPDSYGRLGLLGQLR